MSAEWSKRWLITRICGYCGNQLIVLSSSGLENMYVFKNHASSILSIKTNNNKDCLSEAITHLSKTISAELAESSKTIKSVFYNLGSLHEIAEHETSDTHLKLLASVHLKDRKLNS